MAKNSMSASLPLLTRTYCEMFRRGMFGFICEHDGLKHEKQEHALRLLTDYEHTEILYGGAAGQVLPGCFFRVCAMLKLSGLSDVQH